MLIQAESGHTIHIEKMQTTGLGSRSAMNEHPAPESDYTDFYIARNWDKDGCTFFYLAKGFVREKTEVRHGELRNVPDKAAAREVHVWYWNKKMWSGYGVSLKNAIAGAQRDGWLHAD